MRSLERLTAAIRRGGISKWDVYELCKELGEMQVLAGESQDAFEGGVRAAVWLVGPVAEKTLRDGLAAYFASDWPEVHGIRRREANAS